LTSHRALQRAATRQERQNGENGENDENAKTAKTAKNGQNRPKSSSPAASKRARSAMCPRNSSQARVENAELNIRCSWFHARAGNARPAAARRVHGKWPTWPKWPNRLEGPKWRQSYRHRARALAGGIAARERHVERAMNCDARRRQFIAPATAARSARSAACLAGAAAATSAAVGTTEVKGIEMHQLAAAAASTDNEAVYDICFFRAVSGLTPGQPHALSSRRLGAGASWPQWRCTGLTRQLRSLLL
jgi:hypothetical protein